MKNIFVGNLDFSATESSLRALFEPYGRVDRVNLVTDPDTGRSRGFAFVEMTDSAEADRPIAALNGAGLEAARSTLTRRARRLKVGVADSHADPKAAGASDGSPAGSVYRPASAIVAVPVWRCTEDTTRENIIVQAQSGDASSGSAPEGRLDSSPSVEPTAHV